MFVAFEFSTCTLRWNQIITENLLHVGETNWYQFWRNEYYTIPKLLEHSSARMLTYLEQDEDLSLRSLQAPQQVPLAVLTCKPTAVHTKSVALDLKPTSSHFAVDEEVCSGMLLVAHHHLTSS